MVDDSSTSGHEAWGALSVAAPALTAVAGWVVATILATGIPLLGVGVAVVGCAVTIPLAAHQWRLLSSLRTAADTDALTRLPNRRAFHRLLEAELRQRRDGDKGLSVALIDVDDFKSINDRLGHLGGDMSLERVSSVISACKRRIDLASRLGGDEFALVLPGSGPLEALSVVERIQQRLAESFDKTATKVTLSIGIATAPKHGVSPEELLHAADEAMYVAKGLGKDRAAIYSDEAVRTLRADWGPLARPGNRSNGVSPAPVDTGRRLTPG